jgi:hypothetical protein
MAIKRRKAKKELVKERDQHTLRLQGRDRMGVHTVELGDKEDYMESLDPAFMDDYFNSFETRFNNAWGRGYIIPDLNQ